MSWESDRAILESFLGASEASAATTDPDVVWIRTQYNQVVQAHDWAEGKNQQANVTIAETLMAELAAKITKAWASPANAIGANFDAVTNAAEAARKALEFSIWPYLLLGLLVALGVGYVVWRLYFRKAA